MKLFILSPYFTPFTGVGALRMTSLIKYLVGIGTDVTVAKLDDMDYPKDARNGNIISEVDIVTFRLGKSEAETVRSIEHLVIRLFKERRFDCCIVTFGPYYTVKPTITIMEHFNVPVIIDYRDLWLYDSRPALNFKHKIRGIIYRLMNYQYEKKIMEKCSAFVSVSPASVKAMEYHYPMLKNKTLCIYNGYTPIQMDTFVPMLDSKKINLCFLGKLAYYSSGDAKMMFKAIGNLLCKGYPIGIIHIGMKEDIHALLEECGISDAYQEFGQMKYSKAMSLACQSDIFVEIINYSIGLGTKVFDYIYLNKPIVAVAPKGSELKNLLEDAENAYICQTQRQIEEALENIISGNKRCLTMKKDYLKRFSRESQNEIYEELIEKISNYGELGHE